MKKNYKKPTITVTCIAVTSMIAASINGVNGVEGLGRGGNTSDNSITEGGAKSRRGDDDCYNNGWPDGLW